MKISIEYCSVWNYLPKASSLESELKQVYPDAEITLISSGGGVFEVVIDGRLIFSKKSLDRFPNQGEIASLINKEWSKFEIWNLSQ